MATLAWPRREPLWKRLLGLIADPDAFGRAPAAQPSPGLAAGEGHFYSDGFRPGDCKYSYGVLADLLAQNPGWYLADGTVTLQNGLTPPDMRDRFIVGAGTTYALGATGGAATLSAHTHAFTQPNNHVFTQPSAHVVTQPVYDNNIAQTHDNNHTETQPTGHSNHAAHTGAQNEVAVTGGSGVWVNTYGSSALAAAGLAHAAHDNNHVGSDVAAHSDHAAHGHNRSTDVALSNNHAGGAVDAHAGGAVGAVTGTVAQLPPYAAWYLLVKKY